MNTSKSIEEIKNDYHLFIDIQMGKFFKLVNQSAFLSEQEAQNILSKIMESYNKLIAHEHLRLDNTTIEAKTAWFNSIEIDFLGGTQALPKEPLSKESHRSMDNVVAYYDDIFPFLPKGSVLFLLFAGPALEAYGYSLDRFKKLMEGVTPSGIEKDVLQWAYDITALLSIAHRESNSSEKDKHYLKSLEIAKLELDDNIARKVVSQIYSNIEEHFADIKKNKGKNRR